MRDGPRVRFGKKARTALSVLGCLPLPFFLALLGPLEAFSSNREELGFAAGDFLPLCILFGGLAAALLFLLLFFLPDGGFRAVFPVILAMSVSAAVLPFVNRLSGLPGDRLSEASAFQGVCGLVLPVVLIAGALCAFLFVRRTELLATVSFFVLIPLLVSGLVSFVSIPLSDPGVFSPSSDELRKSGTVTTEGISDLGEEADVLYFCVDRLDEDFCRAAESLDPTVFDSLDGFTRYTDHVTLYSNTYPAVCYMLTGHQADFSAVRSVNFREGYSSPRLLGALKDAGYSSGIYADGYYCFGTVRNIADYADNLLADGRYEVTAKAELSLEMLAVSLFRSSPSVLSPLFSDLSTELLTSHLSFVSEDRSAIAFDSGNRAVRDELARRGFGTVGGKRFAYVHIEGMHDVLTADEDPEATLARLQECFAMVNAYLDALREAGLYRNATIVVTGDHPSPVSDWRSVEEPRVTALFVKRRGDAETPLKTSSAQVYQGQIASEILDSEGIALNDSDPPPLSSTPEGATVERIHHFIVRTSEGFRLETYRITGPAGDFANWEQLAPVSYKKDPYQ